MARALVIGAGLSGLATALMLHQRGHSCTVVSRGIGGLLLSPGTISILGRQGEKLVGSIAPAFEELVAQHPDHPYAYIGANAVASGCDWLRGATGFFVGAEDFRDADASGVAAAALSTLHNVYVPTAVGSVRASAYVPRSMKASVLHEGAKYLVAGLSSVKDFPAQLIADNLARNEIVSVTARAVTLNIQARAQEIDSTPTNWARSVDSQRDGDLVRELVQQLCSEIQPGETVLLPAILGLDPEGYSQIEQQVGVPIGEIPMPPPSIPGRRINDCLVQACADARIDIQHNATVVGVEYGDGRIDGVKVQRAGRITRERPDVIVHAAGGFESGALERDSYGVIRDTVCGLPVYTPAVAPPDFEAEAIFRSGVRVNERMNPLGDDGEIMASNLYCVGSVLAGSLPWKEHSGEGIALGSAWAAAEAINDNYPCGVTTSRGVTNGSEAH